MKFLEIRNNEFINLETISTINFTDEDLTIEILFVKHYKCYQFSDDVNYNSVKDVLINAIK